MMGSCVGRCVFRCGYTLYADTCIGRCIHNRYIDSFWRQFGENAVHTKLTPFTFNDLLVLPIPVLTSNYAYMVGDMQFNNFILVDVGDATLIRNIICQPEAILTTHKHWDHSGGNRTMRAIFPNLKIYGGALDHVPDSTDSVADGDVLHFGRLKFTSIWTPGHTRGHIVWRLHGEVFGTSDSLFTGDHLMMAACGAAFERPVKQMIASLHLLTVLPDDTLVWPGHEMGNDSLQLAVFIEPDNIYAVLKLVWATSQRDQMLCTCPSTIGEEKMYNPFLRTHDEALWKALGIYDDIKSNAISEDSVSSYCFHCILMKSGEMRQLKRKMLETANKNEEAAPDASKSSTEQAQNIHVEDHTLSLEALKRFSLKHKQEQEDISRTTV